MCEGRTVHVLVVMVFCGLLCEDTKVVLMIGMVCWS